MKIGIIEPNLTWPLIFKSNVLDSENGKRSAAASHHFSDGLGLKLGFWEL